MAKNEDEITIILESDKPLGFRLVQCNKDEERNGRSLKVAKVRRKSQAFKRGIQPGNIIVNIKGYTGQLTYDEVMDYLRLHQNDNATKSEMIITVKRGREYGDNEPVLCISHKPQTTAANAHSTTAATGSSSPTPATNVCCVHGVQSKPTATPAAENAAHKYQPPPAPAAPAPRKEEKPKQESEAGGGALSSLFNLFKKDTTTTTTSAPHKEPPKSDARKAPVPPPPAPPQKALDKKDDQQQSWIQRAFQFTEGFTTKGGKSEETKTTSSESNRTSSHRSMVTSESIAAPQVPYIIKTTPISSSLQQQSASSAFESGSSLPYPSFGGSGSDNYNRTSSLFVRTTGSGISQPSPSPVPEVTIGQSTVQIHVKPSNQYMSSSYTHDADSGNQQSRTAIWTAEPTAQTFSPSGESYYTRSTQRYTSTTTSGGDAGAEDATVQRRRRQWPPPSNASGVEIVKDMWLDGTGGSVAELDAPMAQAADSQYQSTYATSTTARDFGSQRTPYSTSTGDVDADELAENVTAAALRKSKFGDQLAEQVRMCKTIARALKTPPLLDKPSKAQRMFSCRKNRMEKWSLTSPPPSSIPEEAASVSSESSHRTFEPIRSTDTFEVIRSTPINQQLHVDSNNLHDGSNDVVEYTGDSTVPVDHYKKYSRYSYRSTSSYQSAVDNDNDLHLPKKARNPLGEVHDYQTLTNEYGDNVSTNVPSAEKYHELSHALTSDSQGGKGVEMFHRKRQKAEDWVVDSKPRISSRSMPPVAPRRHLVNIDPAEIIESVHEAAARKEETIAPPSRGRTTYTPVPTESYHVTRHHTSLNDFADGAPSSVKSPTPTFAARGHERLFSPTPFSFSSTPRPYTPVDFGHGRRTPLPESYHGDYSRPDVTTSVIAVSSPSSRIVATVDQNTPSSKINTLPRSWKSFSSAYRQNYP